MSKKTKKGGKKLSAQELQIQILRFLLAHSKKRYSARHIIEHLAIDNSKDSVVYALEQLQSKGSVEVFSEERYGVALQHLLVDDVFAEEENSPIKEFKKSKPRLPLKEDISNEIVHKTEENQPSEPFSFEKKPSIHKKAIWEDATENLAIAEKPSNFEAFIDKDNKKTKGKTPAKSSDFGRKIVEGRMDMTRTGSGYVQADSEESDIFVPVKYMNSALHGDIVQVTLFASRPQIGRSRNTQIVRKPEGEVTKIVKRATEHFIGTIRMSRKYALFLPDNPNMPTDVYVPLEECLTAKDGEKVVVQVTDWQEGSKRVPLGRVTSVLGAVGGNDFEMKKILIGQGFELEHSEAAIAEAMKIPDDISPNEIAIRRDFRDVLTFTIDPEDAKDFDDALSIKELEDGNLEIGVHIADVTHFLKADTQLDKEAYQRSTSVYLVDRVNPMLPEKLSNNLCSLVPHEDRLTFSAVFVFDQKDNIKSSWFGKTVIHSAHRFSYEGAQTLIDKNPSEELQDLPIYPQLKWAMENMLRISQKMRTERFKNGAIGFESDEIRFKLAEDGSPIEAYIKERKEANLLIEDFMLLANKEVALFIDKKAAASQEIPFIYRIHDLPDMEKVAEFSKFAKELGYPMRVDTPKQIANSYNGLMKAIKTDEKLKLLEPLAIRTMSKAVYSSNNIGHYGLGYTHYSHFTSPIRRYSDVLAHRILERNLDGKTYHYDKERLEVQCKHISLQEKKAADCERESTKYKQAEYAQRLIGKTVEGVISGIIERGFFVELIGSKAEGLVPFKDLGDTFTLQNGNLSAKGRRSGHTFKMGDNVKVQISSVDLMKRQIEMVLIE
jgi:ribonuclease R